MASIKSLLLAAAAAVPALASNYPIVNVYWGQRGVGDRLIDYCKSSGVDTVTLAFVNVSPENAGNSGYPGTNFAAHCSDEVFIKDGVPTKLLSGCYQIKEDIPKCQALGKKVLISIGGVYNTNSLYSISTVENGRAFGAFMWSAFGPYEAGWTGPRPFDLPGSHVSLDGFDFDIEFKFVDQTPWVAMVNYLRAKIQASGLDIILTAAPQCRLDDPYIQMKDIMMGSQFDRFFIQFYNNVDCPSLDKWYDFIKTTPSANAKLHIGLLASVDAGGLGYLGPDDAIAWLCQYANKDYFGGVSLWDGYFGSQNKAGNETFYELVMDGLAKCGPSRPKPTTTSATTVSSTSSTSTSKSTSSIPTTTSTTKTTSTASSTTTSTTKTSTTSKSSTASSTTTSTTTSTTKTSTSSTSSTASSTTTSATETSTTKSSSSASTSSTLTSSSLSSSSSTESASSTTSTTSSSVSSISSSSTSQTSGTSSSTLTETQSSTGTSTIGTSATETSTIGTSATETSTIGTSTTETSTTYETTSTHDTTKSGTTTTETSATSTGDITTKESSTATVTSTSETMSSATSTSEVEQTTSTSKTTSETSTISETTTKGHSTTSASTSETSAPPTSAEVTTTSPPLTTSTIRTTAVYTITSCAPTVTNCPVGSVTTSIIDLYTTVCPVTSSGHSSATYSHQPSQVTSASEVTGTSMTTSTIYTTTVYTVTSCPPSVPSASCPAHLGSVTTEVVAVATTVCPVSASTPPASSAVPVLSLTSAAASPTHPSSSGSGAGNNGNKGGNEGAHEVPTSITSSVKIFGSTATANTLTRQTTVVVRPLPTGSTGAAANSTGNAAGCFGRGCTGNGESATPSAVLVSGAVGRIGGGVVAAAVAGIVGMFFVI